MKLHLPKKFKTALMAAFATVSFTTVSTASLGAAVFAFAGYQAAAEETATTEESAADKAGQKEIRDNIRALQEEQDEEDESEFTVDPADQGIMERRAKNLERAGDGAASGIAKAAYDAMEAEIFNPEAATTAAPAQQQTSTGSGELPSDDLGFTSNPYASSSGNSEPVFEVTPAAATTTDFLQETSTEEESSGSSSGSSSPASASGFGGSADSGYSGGGYSPFGLALGSIAPISVGETGSLVSATLLGDAARAWNLVWEGDSESKGTWKNGGDDTSSPWTYTPPASDPVRTAFQDGDLTEFKKSAEVTVSGDVQTSSLQIDAGSEQTPIVVTINTPENTTLTADHVVSLDLYEEGAPYTNKIVKTGAGEVNFSVDDPNFVTQLEIKEGDATINFNQLSDGQNYYLYTYLDADTGSNVTVNVNGAGTTKTVTFQASSLLGGIDKYNVADGLTVEINSARLAGGGFYLDKERTTINLGSGSILNSLASTEEVKAKNLTVRGTGENKSEAYFHNMFLFHGADRAVHNLSDNVYVKISTLTVDENSPDTTMQIDDESSLHIVTMNTGYYNVNESFFHAFQNGGVETQPQAVTIESLLTNSGRTIHLGAASLEQGAKEGYQEAGTVNVTQIYGYGTLVLENNVEVVNNPNQCLTEVFNLDHSDAGYGDLAAIRLAATNNGTADRRKEVVVDFQSAYTLYNYGNLELQADADYTDYKVLLSYSYGFSGNGIDDVDGHGVHDHSTAMIYSDVEGSQIRVQLFADSGKKYESSFGMSSGIDIDFSGEGSQTFKGDFKDFKGNVTVGGTKVLGSTLSFIEQKTALNIVELVLRPDATLNVKEAGSDSKNQLIKVSRKLTAQAEVQKDQQTTLYGDSAVVNGDLQMEADSVYDVSDFRGWGGLDLKGALTFDKGALLSDKDMAMINGMEIGDMYDLAFNVSSLNGNAGVIDWIGDNRIDASTIFGQDQFYQGEFYLCYSGNGLTGGHGNNVGTVYLYRALPEPTTGTLSLLALAALAARRRRK